MGSPKRRSACRRSEAEHDVVHGARQLPDIHARRQVQAAAAPLQHRGGQEVRDHFDPARGHGNRGLRDGRASRPPSYTNSFTCIPDAVIFRPARITPKPVVQGVQTAVVVGPAGEEIYPDKYGRVKVQFHWDREGKKDESSSCWVRVSQIHAGQSFGGIDIPRIGEEVVVGFLEGDPDRPMITGRVYHAENMPPFGLPGSKTISGLKSKTYKGGGYNEFVMDDTTGNELIREHGQYDKDSTIEHDLREHVLHDRSRDVTNNETIQIGVDRTETVGANESLTVGSNKTIKIGVNHGEMIGANMTISVGSNLTETVGINYAETVGAAMQLTVGAVMVQTIGATYTLTVGASMTETIGSNRTTNIGGSRKEQVASKVTEKVGGNVTQQFGGKHSEKVSGNYTLKSGDGDHSASPEQDRAQDGSVQHHDDQRRRHQDQGDQNHYRRDGENPGKISPDYLRGQRQERDQGGDGQRRGVGNQYDQGRFGQDQLVGTCPAYCRRMAGDALARSIPFRAGGAGNLEVVVSAGPRGGPLADHGSRATRRLVMACRGSC